MNTSAISYRVADFLKKHPPFHAVDDADLLELAGRGRVRFHEANEYILWQGEPHKDHVFVIQQGTVSLWDEGGERAVLRDVRGAGDMLGLERYGDARQCLHSARSTSDVVIYAFPAWDFEALVLKYPYAQQFVEATGAVTADYQWAKDTADPRNILLHDVVARQVLHGCDARTSIAEVARAMLATGAEAIAIVDEGQRARGAVTAESLLAWIAAGAGDAGQPIAGLVQVAPPAVGLAASVTDGVLALAETGSAALALTSDGSPDGHLHALLTSRDVSRVFGDQPVSILQEGRRATSVAELRDLTFRARALALRYLAIPASLDWLARFEYLHDVNVVQRIIALVGEEPATACWCFCGASGREESLTRHAPQLVLIVEDERACPVLERSFGRVTGALAECGYLPRTDLEFGPSFLVACRAEWMERFAEWVHDPVRSQMYRARSLFDLRPVHGRDSLWRDMETTVAGALDLDFVRLLANDCLASLPPLTFYEGAVIEESGDHTGVFRLEHSALQPLVDVGRVFGMAARRVFGTSTRQRYMRARTLLPEHESIFREASETLRVLLWQQARIGISQDTTGSELPPALLSRHDRHILKGGFGSILRLLELTGNSPWFAAL